MVNIAVLGVGRIGKYHIDNLSKMRDKFNIVAIADPYVDNLDEIANYYNIPHYFNDHSRVLELDEVDAVLIATSTDTHAPISIEAARAGKHIFCEKPVDTEIEKIKEVIEEVEKADVYFQVGFNRRFDPSFSRVRERVENGDIGDVHYIKISSRDPEPPSLDYVKVSGGLFLDMMIHDFDMARYIVGSEVKEIYATGEALINPEIKKYDDIDTAAVTLKFENGAIGQIDNSRQAVYGYDQRLEVFGTKGQAIAYNDTRNNVEYFDKEGVHRDKIPFFFLDRYVDAFNNQYIEFYEALTEKRQPLVSTVDGLKSVELALAAKESLKKNKPVKL